MTRLPVSQSQFARDIGCEHTLVSRYRSGERLPTVKQLALIIETYDLDPRAVIAAVNRAEERDADGNKIHPKAFGLFLRDNVFSTSAAQAEKSYAGFVVVLDDDLSEPDAQDTLNALRMVRGVASVEPVVSDPLRQITQARAAE